MINQTRKKLYNYAVYLLSRRSYYSTALYEKLVKKEIGGAEDIEFVMGKMREYKFINDEQYVRNYIRDQLLCRPQGIRLLRQKMYRKGIKGEFVEQELALYEPKEMELARTALQKKEKLLGKGSGLAVNKRREKLFRFLAGRGFSIDTIYKIVPK